MGVEWGRRHFLISTGLASGFYLSGCKTTDRSGLSGADIQAPRVRKRWVAGSDSPDQLAFIKCIEWLRANDVAMEKDETKYPPEDPRSYLTYNNIVSGHANACQHGNWLIFPWHRHYLDYFENACRYILQDENFALPYWDWTLDRKIPSDFFTNPILQKDRNFGPDSMLEDKFVGQEVIDKVLAATNHQTVHSYRPPILGIRGGPTSGAFESGPHNGVHRSVGKTMGDQWNSPQDPLFWLHHANIDRIWATWQDRNPTRLLPYVVTTETPVVVGPEASKIIANPPPHGGLSLPSGLNVPIWENQELNLVWKRGEKRGDTDTLLNDLPTSPKNRVVVGKVTVSDVLHIKSFGYTYDTLPAPLVQISQKLVVRKEKRSVIALLAATTRDKANLKSTIPVGAKDPEAKALLARFTANPKAIVTLFAEGIVPPHDQAVQSRVQIRLFIEGIEAGIYVFFGHAGHGEEGASSEVGMAFEVTSQLRSILQTKALEELRISAIAEDNVNPKTAPDLFSGSPNASLSLEFSFLKA